MRPSKSLLFSVLVLLLITTNGMCASLWLNGRDLYSSQGGREYSPGDIITVVIAEEASAQQAATTNTQDDAAVEVKTDPEIPLFKKITSKLIGKNEVKNSWKGNGTTTRSGKLAGTITATVMEVMANGNLLIEGKRAIRVNKETQHLKVRGVARPQDIDSRNTINSRNLADAEIKYEGKGSIGSTQRPGIITKITNFIF
jgi:flagellar L-ring protein precursor FlgH